MKLKCFLTAKLPVASSFIERSLQPLRPLVRPACESASVVVAPAAKARRSGAFRYGCALLAAALLALAPGCRSDTNTDAADAQKTEAASARSAARLPAQTYFPLQLGDKEIRVQLALTDAERGRGLMGRKALDTDHGMLFVFEQPSQQSFWMANTPLPLDIGYFDAAGILREVYPLYPFDRTSVVSRRGDIRYALEMTQGWFAQNGIRPGAALNLDALAEALRSRGF